MTEDSSLSICWDVHSHFKFFFNCSTVAKTLQGYFLKNLHSCKIKCLSCCLPMLLIIARVFLWLFCPIELEGFFFVNCVPWPQFLYLYTGIYPVSPRGTLCWLTPTKFISLFILLCYSTAMSCSLPDSPLSDWNNLTWKGKF